MICLDFNLDSKILNTYVCQRSNSGSNNDNYNDIPSLKKLKDKAKIQCSVKSKAKKRSYNLLCQKSEIIFCLDNKIVYQNFQYIKSYS